MKLSIRTLVVLGSLGLCAFAGTGVSRAADGAERDASAASEETKQRQEFGPVRLIGAALDEVNLSKDQKAAIEKIGKKAMAADHVVNHTQRALLLDIADGLEKGHVDRETVDADVQAFVRAREDASGPLREALTELHEILTPDQRNEFVDAIEKRVKKGTDFVKSGKVLKFLGRDLDLTDEQKEEIRDAVEKSEPEAKKDLATAREVFEAFRCDSFDIDRVAPADTAATGAKARANRMMGIAEAIGRVLTPEQRCKVAEKIREAFSRKAK